VFLDMPEADLESGGIPGDWLHRPQLFVAITGMVTEVGGLMIRGAVIARGITVCPPSSAWSMPPN
jgi:hypothetical protein